MDRSGGGSKMSNLSANLSYFFSKEKQFNTGRLLNLSDFESKGWDLDNYHIPALDCAVPLNKGWILAVQKMNMNIMHIPQQPLYTQEEVNAYWRRPYFIPDYVKEAIAKSSKPNRIYTHYAGSLITKETFTPPFHVQVLADIPYVDGLLPCPAWLYHCVERTEEFDMGETSQSDIWFAHNYSAKPNWGGPHYCSGDHLWWCPKGIHQIDLEVTTTTAKWYLDGHPIKTRRGDFLLPYFILSTMIVHQSYCVNTQMIIKQLSIEI